MCAASLLKYPTLLWGQKSFACGHARLRHVTAAAGSKRSAERGLRKLSCSSKTERRTSRVNRRTMGGSLLPSRTLWSIRVDIRPLRRGEWRGERFPMVFFFSPRAPRLFSLSALEFTLVRFLFFLAPS